MCLFITGSGNNNAWIGARNDIWGNNKFLWLSDKGEVDTSLYGEAPNEYANNYAALWVYSAFPVNRYISDNPYTTGRVAACEIVPKGIFYLSINFGIDILIF